MKEFQQLLETLDHDRHNGKALPTLPERPIESVLLEDSVFTYDAAAKPFAPAMADGVDECLRLGIVAHYVDHITLRNVSISGQQGEKLATVQAGSVHWEGEQ